MTVVEFRRINGSNSDADVFIGRRYMRTVPTVGELINLNGHPYVVHERSWAAEVTPDPDDAERKDYAYLRVVIHHGSVHS